MRDRQRSRATLSSSALRVISAVRRHVPRLETLPLVSPMAGSIRGGVRVVEAAAYRRWLSHVEPSAEQVRSFARSPLNGAPLVSIVMPVYKPDPAVLLEAVDSVKAQTHGHWQLCLCNDGSPDPALVELLDSVAASDDRIKAVHRPENGGISAATNDAIASADGEFVAFMDQDDVLAPWALHFVATAIARHPRARLLYSDEDKLDDRGRRIHPHFKPDWDPFLLETNNYVCHLLVIHRALVDAVGGLRSRFDGAQDYDLVLRCSATLDEDEIVHIPAILYHWRALEGSTAADAEAKPYAHVAGKLALVSYFGDRVSEVLDGPSPFRYSPRFRPTPSDTTISLIVWGEGATSPEVVAASVPEGWQPAEILTPPARSAGEPLSDWLASAIESATGQAVLFASKQLRLRSLLDVPTLVARLDRNEPVGAVGPKIIDQRGNIDYPDVAIPRTLAATIRRSRFEKTAHGYGGRLQLSHAVEALSLSCLLVRRDALIDLELRAPLDNDAAMARAIGMHLRSKGLRSVYEPLAEVQLGTTPSSRDAEHAHAHAHAHVRTVDTPLVERHRYYPSAFSRDRADYSIAMSAPRYLRWLAGPVE